MILPKESNLESNYSLILNTIEYERTSRVVIGEDERKPYMCYAGTEIAEHALSSAAAKIGGYGSCSLIGNENHVLTNQHVVSSDSGLTRGEIWFNWFNQSCSPTSPVNEPVRLKPGRLLKVGAGPSSDADYALLTLDDFDYVNSQVKALFGGLKLSQNNPAVKDPIYISQYGNGGLRPMYVSDMENGEFAQITAIENNGNRLKHNADTQSGSSGSPIISRKDNQLVGLHWGAAGSANLSVSAQKLNLEIGSLLQNSNISVIGLGNVSSTNLELTPITLHENLISIDLGKKGGILPFDTLQIEDYEDYSILKMNAIDLVTNEIFPLKCQANLVNKDYQTNLHNDDITGKVFLNLYNLNADANRLLKFWVTFKISDYRHNLKNHVIRVVLDNYDPYEIPFDISNAEILDFKVNKETKNVINYTVADNDYYGFIALYRDEGPMSLVWSLNGYSEVKILVRNVFGHEVIVKFRGMRQTTCGSKAMNSAISCTSSNKYSRFVLQYHPEDNENLILEDEIYEGILPLQAKSWNEGPSKNILVKVSLSLSK